MHRILYPLFHGCAVLHCSMLCCSYINQTLLPYIRSVLLHCATSNNMRLLFFVFLQIRALDALQRVHPLKGALPVRTGRGSRQVPPKVTRSALRS